MLETITIDPKTASQGTVIWLHGLGADGYDFAPVAEQMHSQFKLPLRFIFPHAPLRPVTLNNGYVMRAWYDIYGLDDRSHEDQAGIAKSAEQVGVLIQHEINSGTPAKKIILAGFSQGGAIALYTGLRYSQSLAGIICLSGYLPLKDNLTSEADPANQTTPIFMAHGTQDNIVPINWGEFTKNHLQNHHYQLTWKTYPMAHMVCMEEINDLVAWLRQLYSVD